MLVTYKCSLSGRNGKKNPTISRHPTNANLAGNVGTAKAGIPGEQLKMMLDGKILGLLLGKAICAKFVTRDRVHKAGGSDVHQFKISEMFGEFRFFHID
jgi:hypothetical protein